jgi:hypothetical protein
MGKKNLKVVKDEEVVETQATVESAPDVTPEYNFISTEDAKAYSDDELNAKIEELENVAESWGNEMKTKKYRVKVESIKNAKSLLKYLEKNVKWAHNSLPSYIAVCHGLKDAIINEGVSEEGFIHLGATPVGMIYQTMLQVTGTGYFEAKEYLRILTEVGGGISDAMKELADDNTQLRNIHTDLSTLDTEKMARSQGIEVAADAPKEANNESKA